MMSRLALAGAVAALALVAFPAAGSATSIPGPNGKIAFASGRGNSEIELPVIGDDSAAKIWVADYPDGTPQQVTMLPLGLQHRDPDWSPNHSKIAYAAGVAGNENDEYSIWIADLRTGTQTEFVAAAPHQGWPAWSPDGTEIAYVSNGDLWVEEVAPGSTPVRLTDTEATEESPVWSPDGDTLYYNRGPESNRDIYAKSPVTPSGAEVPIVTTPNSNWQPAVSPDGKRLCFTRGSKGADADIYTINVTGGTAVPFAESLSGNTDCSWSPDGTRILYTQGILQAGDLVTRNINGGLVEALGINVQGHADGESDWATNFPPRCDSKFLALGVNQSTTITLSCIDPDLGTGGSPPTPTPLRTEALKIAMGPSHGTISPLSNGNVTYTPIKDFQGTDAFTYTGFDGTSNAVPASVTIQVGNPPQGGDTSAPAISAIKLSAKRWRLGKTLAKISKAPVGTTISFDLSEAARTSLTFQRAQRGRRSGKSCVKQTTGNRSRPKCTRHVNAGSINFDGKAGQNKVRFQGLITKSRKLSLGTYKVVVAARDAAGNRSSRAGPTFTIVQG